MCGNKRRKPPSDASVHCLVGPCLLSVVCRSNIRNKHTQKSRNLSIFSLDYATFVPSRYIYFSVDTCCSRHQGPFPPNLHIDTNESAALDEASVHIISRNSQERPAGTSELARLRQDQDFGWRSATYPTIGVVPPRCSWDFQIDRGGSSLKQVHQGPCSVLRTHIWRNESWLS